MFSVLVLLLLLLYGCSQLDNRVQIKSGPVVSSCDILDLRKMSYNAKQVQDLYRAGPRNFFFVVLDIRSSAAELLDTCCRDSADLLPCCRGAAQSRTDAMFYSAADLQQRCCRPAAEMLQTYCCPAAEEL